MERKRKKYTRGLDNSGNIEGISNAILSQSRWECTPWAAEATSGLPAGPAACHGRPALLAAGRPQARAAGHGQDGWLVTGQPARPGLLKRDEHLKLGCKRDEAQFWNQYGGLTTTYCDPWG